MSNRIATVVIEARSLVREALVSLVESHSYHVVCSLASTGQLDSELPGDIQPELVILVAPWPDRGAEITSRIHRLWPAAKIIVLFEQASPPHLQSLVASGVNACVPLSVSPHTLIDILELIVREDFRIAMQSGTSASDVSISRQVPGDDALHHGQGIHADPQSPLGTSHLPGPFESALLAKDRCEVAVRAISHGLSEREEQILKALVRGHSNKVIARLCAVTEATVKVHMKSILRKIRVANRTQAAIWALANGYFSDEVNSGAEVKVQTHLSPANRDERGVAIPSVGNTRYSTRVGT